jgi:beta-lactamase regulating signal transducer with metallopeptidase domain
MIAHELAHIRRHDLWINLFQRAIETLLFYHPAVWWVSGRMRLERELCCDDAAIRATGKRADYANALVGLARSLHGWTAPVLSAGMFTSRVSLPERVRRVLQIPSTQHDPHRGRY